MESSDLNRKCEFHMLNCLLFSLVTASTTGKISSIQNKTWSLSEMKSLTFEPYYKWMNVQFEVFVHVIKQTE